MALFGLMMKQHGLAGIRPDGFDNIDRFDDLQ
jgi:hypothetical protein